MADDDKTSGAKPEKTPAPAGPSSEADAQAAALAQIEADARAAKAARVDDIIGAWIADQIHHSPVARDTASYNHLTQVAIPALRLAILGGE